MPMESSQIGVPETCRVGKIHHFWFCVKDGTRRTQFLCFYETVNRKWYAIYRTLSLPMTWHYPKHPISSIFSSWVFFHIFRTAKAIVFKFCTQAGVVMVMWAILSPNTTVLCTSLETDKHASTSPLRFYKLHALPAAKPIASKHWRHVMK